MFPFSIAIPNTNLYFKYFYLCLKVHPGICLCLGSKQLSSTLQELRVQRTSSRMSRGIQNEDEQQNSPNHPLKDTPLAGPTISKEPAIEKGLLQPLVMQFSVILQVKSTVYENFD